MKVSIITPCYNAADFIETTIKSIQQQTLTDWELLLVDDGSTDNTAEIIHRFTLQDKRIKLLQKENGGTASARKLGLSHAHGDYIQFVDADDSIDTDKLRIQTEYMETHALDVSYTDWCYVTPEGEKEAVKGMNCSLSRLLVFWGTLGTLPIHSFLYRHEFIIKHNITINTAIKEREDWDFHIQIYSAHPRTKRLIGYCGAMYMKAPTGKTTGKSQEKVQIGTLNYLMYKIGQTVGYKKILLNLRFTIELCFLFLRNIRTKKRPILNYDFQKNIEYRKIIRNSILLLPVALLLTFIAIIIRRM